MQFRDPDTIIRNTNPALLTLLDERLNTLVKWDVMQFFYRHSDAIKTAREIAEALSRDLDSVAHAAAELADTGLLEMQVDASTALYMLTGNDAARQEIDAFMSACDNPKFRRCAIQYVLTTAAG
ncbi:MAG: hypothetical protein IT320_27025 [Anaerolineae bacterium]|nr:hypothetical protein [Anaerolineae bacterium]